MFGEVGSVTVGGTPSTSVPDYWDGAIPWMASGDVHGRVIDDVPTRISGLGLRHSSATMVDPPSVAVALAGQGKTRGTAAYVRCALCTNQSVALLKGNPGELDTEYLLHNLSFRYSELRSRSAGGGRAGLTKTILEQLPLPLPAVSEQAKIAEVLSTVDRAIEQSEALIAKQQRIKTGLMQDLLTRGIDEHGNLRSEQTHKFKDSPVGRIPVEWECASFGDSWRASPQNGLYKPESQYSEDGMPIVRIDGFRNGELINHQTFRRVRLAPVESRTFALEAGDLLVNRVNSIEWLGKAALVGSLAETTVFESNMMRIRVDRQWMISEFALLLLSSSHAYNHFRLCAKTAIAQASINQEDARSLLVASPHRVEQQRIVDAVQVAHRGEDRLKDATLKLRLLRTGLMHDLLTGNRRVTALLEQCERVTT